VCGQSGLAEWSCSQFFCIYANGADGGFFTAGVVAYTTCETDQTSADTDSIPACEQAFGTTGFNNSAYNPQDCQGTPTACSVPGQITNVVGTPCGTPDAGC